MTALILLLVLVGFLLLAVEVLVIPGFGLAGILGIAALAAGGILSWTTYGPLWGLTVVSGAVLGSFALLWLVAKTKVGRSIALDARIEGTTADESLDKLVGQTGEALSILRPSGQALIRGDKYAVLTDGQFLEKGRRVVVVRVDAGKLVVEPVEDEAEGAVGDSRGGRAETDDAGDGKDGKNLGEEGTSPGAGLG